MSGYSAEMLRSDFKLLEEDTLVLAHFIYMRIPTEIIWLLCYFLTNDKRRSKG